MEDVLDLYAEPYTTDRPVVCFDELPFQLLADKRASVPAAPGRAARVDYEYRRQGTANLFVCFEPLAGWRRVDVTAQRTNKDFAEQMRALADEYYPTAPRIAVVLDNLSTHSPAALYQTFPPAEARRLVQRLEFHYTPKHGSWLNMAELEFAILIPIGADPHALTQSRKPMDMMVQGWSTSLFQASQQWSRMSV
jgi:hypothetical protein